MYISSLVCIIIRKKNVTNIDKEKKRRTIHVLKRNKTKKYNQHRDIQRQKKNQIMDYINTDDELGK
jgi:hypothetical protein